MRDRARVLWRWVDRGVAARLGGGWQVMSLFAAGGDADSDRLYDLWVRRNDGTLLWYRGFGLDRFAAARVITTGFGNATKVLMIGDANGDGRADLHATWPDGSLYFYPGRGDGSVVPGVRLGGGWGSMKRLVLGRDLTAEGRQDLLAQAADGRVYLYPGTGTGTFSARRLVTTRAMGTIY